MVEDQLSRSGLSIDVVITFSCPWLDILKLMKKLLIFFAILASGLFAREAALVRAGGFYSECLSSEEVELVRITGARNLPEKDLAVFVEEKLSCIESKQTIIERIAFRTMGKYFYYPIFSNPTNE